jgi:hypothetical protein
MIRVYANAFEPNERPWSVDRGSQDTEEHFDIVIVAGAAGHTKEGPKVDGAPTGWLEFTDARLNILEPTETGKRIAYIL